MPVIFVPPSLRDLTGGQEQVTVPGSTVREALASLEERCPGVQDRLMEYGRLRPGIAVAVDGVVTRQRLRCALSEGSEVHFLPALSGG